MTEERATYQVPPTNNHVKAVRLENFRDPDWQTFLQQRLFTRYPAARVASRRPHVLLIELRSSQPWTQDDALFFAHMRREGFFQRWETLAEFPPEKRRNQAVYQDIGYRIGAGERLTPVQQEALFSHLHALEERTERVEKEADGLRLRAALLEEQRAFTTALYNELVTYLDQELQLKVSSDGKYWMAEDSQTGEVLLRDVALPVLYRKALRLRLEKRT